MLDFFKTYKNKRKFFTYRGVAGHEITGAMNRFVDDELSRVLEEMEKRGYLENTILMIYSDHGNHINLALRYTQSGDVEMRNPFFFTVLGDPELKQKYGKSLEENRDKLITHFDLFTTSMGILGVEDWKMKPEKKLFDFLREVVPKERSCTDALIDEDQCRCKIQLKNWW